MTGPLTETALRCQSILAKNPQHPEALLGISLVALASHQTGAAIQTATAATNANPRKLEAWITLGQAFAAAARFGEAERAYARALRLDGMHPLARLGLGELRLASNRPDDAMAEFQLVLRIRPASVPAYLGIGNAQAILDRNEEALASFERAIALQPRAAEAHFAAGFVLARLDRATEAETHYRRALYLRPTFAVAWGNLGALLREQGRRMAAEAAMRRAVELRPNLISAWVNLAQLACDCGRNEEAEKYLRRALTLNPEHIETLLTWSRFRHAEGDQAGAWRWLRWALAQNAEHGEAVNMQGILLHTEGRFDEAVEAFAHAEALGHHTAASNRGNALIELGRISEALRAHETAVARAPHSAGVRYNLALTQLRAGDWARGWPGYEARWQFREVHRRPLVFKQPRWRGELLDGKRILLHAEQGLGDTIQFCRYAALVAARGGWPILAVQPPVERLMHSLAPVRAGLAEVAPIRAKSSRSNFDFDCECPLMSLPAAFATTTETAPWSGAYLAADPDAIRAREAEYPGLDSSVRVGLAWAGNPRYKADAQRSVQLAALLPLLRGFDANWFSLQKGEAAAQIACLPAGVTLHDASSNDRDLAETAALIATLDLVITTDTCIAHLAGAMAKPVWMLLPYVADWRWMQTIATTPWYPTARLFRQSARGDWRGVTDRVLAELRSLAFPSRREHVA